MPYSACGIRKDLRMLVLSLALISPQSGMRCDTREYSVHNTHSLNCQILLYMYLCVKKPSEYFWVYFISVSVCSSNPCQNGGTCEPSGDEYICHCPEWIVGDECKTGRNSKLSGYDAKHSVVERTTDLSTQTC